MTEPTEPNGTEFPILSEEDLADLNQLVLGDPEERARLQKAAMADYKAKSRKTRNEVLIAEYSCEARGCLLLHVWNTPHGQFYYQPRYRLSPAVNEATSVSLGSNDADPRRKQQVVGPRGLVRCTD